MQNPVNCETSFVCICCFLFRSLKITGFKDGKLFLWINLRFWLLDWGGQTNSFYLRGYILSTLYDQSDECFHIVTIFSKFLYPTEFLNHRTIEFWHMQKSDQSGFLRPYSGRKKRRKQERSCRRPFPFPSRHSNARFFSALIRFTPLPPLRTPATQARRSMKMNAKLRRRVSAASPVQERFGKSFV